MRGKVARAFRHYALTYWERLSEEQRKNTKCRKIYRAMKRTYKEGRRCLTSSLSG